MTVAGGRPVFSANEPDVAIGFFQQSPVNVQGGRCRPAKPADSVAVKVREGDELPGRVHRLAGGDDDGLGEEVEPGFPVARQSSTVEQFR